MSLLFAQLCMPVLGLLGPALVLLGMPGTWAMLAFAGLLEWGTDARLFSDATLLGVLAVAAAGELWEFAAGTVGARRAGAGKRGALGALGGGILGSLAGTLVIPIPLVGTLVGGGLGAFAGATAMERRSGRDLGASLRIGRAAGFGHMFGLVGKLAASLVAWLWLSIAVFA